MGVGADGCDPQFATIEATGTLATVLNAVPALVAAAETHWRAAPRYPTALRPTVTTTVALAKASSHPKAAVTKAAGVAGAGIDSATLDNPPAKPAATTQISLFG